MEDIKDNAEQPSLKLKTARTLKWNTIDRVSSQVLYAVTGIILANLLSKEDFGLANAVLIFQAFAILFVDSGFGAALLQKKSPTEQDYSTVFWFNLMVSIVVYVVLWFCAPLISDIFHGGELLTSMSRVMFLTFVFNGLGIVQTNRLMKQMNVKQIAVANVAGLTVSGIVGIWLALTGAGAWALVWQSISLSVVKAGWLWVTGGWVPRPIFSTDSLRQIWKVGLGVFSSSFLNTLFLNIYSFIVGAYYNLRALGVYGQADKWSKMGTASLSQVITASFLPVLSGVQDNAETYRRYVGKINRFTAFLLMPAMICLCMIATPLFHILFGQKWDEAIPLFQILCIRGIPVVLIALFNNYILSLGHAKRLVNVEVVKDVITIVAIVATLPFGTVEALVWGQLVASTVVCLYVLWLSARATGYGIALTLKDMTPYSLLAIAAGAGAWLAGAFCAWSAWLQISVLITTGAIIYFTILRLTGSVILKEALEYALGRFRRKASR